MNDYEAEYMYTSGNEEETLICEECGAVMSDGICGECGATL